MTDLVLVATNVIASGGARTVDGTIGETLTAGQVVYLDTATGTYKLADCDSGTAAVRSPAGIALNGGGTGQPVKVLKSGPVSLGAVLTAGVTYYLSPTAGGICPVADIDSADYPVILGIAKSTSVLDVKIHEAGVALA